MLTTNVVLGGVTLVFGLIPFITSAWLIRNMRTKRNGRSFFELFRRKTSVRITVGFIMKICALGAVFLMRMPLRALREADATHASARWLDASLFWEFPLLAVAVVGLGLTMTPLFRKLRTRYGGTRLVLVIAALIAATWALGAGFVLGAAALLKGGQ